MTATCGWPLTGSSTCWYELLTSIAEIVAFNSDHGCYGLPSMGNALILAVLPGHSEMVA